ncbi:MAG: rotamase [Alphaproteobacteria bacterium]|nr:rotamase [Alphaproteobacteria bacterium]
MKQMKKLFTLMILFCCMLTLPAYATMQEIAAVVNDTAISMSDLEKRLRLIIVSSGLQNTNEIKQRIAPQVLGSLVNEQIMLQEAKKIDISVSDEEIEAGIEQIAKQNSRESAEFKKMITSSGIDIVTMRDQVRAQIAWSKFIQARLRSKVVISERDVDATLERLRSKIGTEEYHIAEIFLPVDAQKQEAQVKQLANRLVSEIRSGKASFPKLAQQFSKAAGSTNGGDLGWIQDSHMGDQFLEAVKKIEKKQVTNPIKMPTGYHILFLRDTRTVSEGTMPSRDQIFYSLGNERLDKLQRQHLFDLRAASFIDIRV